ncbi:MULTISPECIES: DUF5050 domain-containing protein [unclassified Clostridium]|uniref:DUF5050 domain-containing protein n=1 Tax=unclassified Clostridium TaxID=2614128 RepID=UPI0025B97C2D|nr:MULTISPECIES: DUF5050 domain-containing protein [unclassified Clostridium]
MSLNYGNINNDGLVYCDGENIYYSNITSDNGKLYSQNLELSDKVKLSDIEEVLYITKYESFLYYVSKNSIYRLNLDNHQNEIIYNTGNELYVYDMSIVGEELFFSVGCDDVITYKMNLKTLISEVIIKNTYGIIVFNNYAYYSLNVGDGLYGLNLNNNEIIQINDTRSSWPIINNTYLYYIDIANNKSTFFRINLNTPNYKKEEIININKEIDYFNIASNYIIYEDYYIYRIDLNTKEIKKINNIKSNEMNIINNEIWFVAYEDSEFKLYKMDLDGGNLTLIE